MGAMEKELNELRGRLGLPPAGERSRSLRPGQRRIHP
jgi:hypothetical protein